VAKAVRENREIQVEQAQRVPKEQMALQAQRDPQALQAQQVQKVLQEEVEIKVKKAWSLIVAPLMVLTQKEFVRVVVFKATYRNN
jgi:hypothetical protein